MKAGFSRSLLICLLMIVCGVQASYAQSLPRRVFLGVRLENLTDDSRRIMQLNFERGVLITEVIARSTAEKAGFKKGDILIRVNDHAAERSSGVVAYLNSQTVGEQFTYEIYRDKKIIKGKSTFQPMPQEQYEGIEMVYAEAPTPLGLERMIISKPAASIRRMAAIVFIGGIGCYSLDFPFDSSNTEVRLLNDLTRSGFLCMRAEKPGMGDNVRTKKCSEVSFMEEMESYVAMIAELKKRPDVDSNSVFLFGHSMGGVFAPLVAQHTKIKGIIGYGTIGSNFLEYLVKTRKTISEAYGSTPEESDQLTKDCTECSVWYFADKMTTAEAAKKKPVCTELLSVFDYRSRAYNDQLYELGIPALWRSYSGKALLLWGTADFIASEDDHGLVTKAVNHYHPGQATFVRVKDSDHGMHTAAGFAAALREESKEYNKDVSRVTLEWLKQQEL